MNTDRVAKGHRVRERDVPPPAQCAKLKLPPFYKVNGKLKEVHCNNNLHLCSTQFFSSSGQGGRPPPLPPT